MNDPALIHSLGGSLTLALKLSAPLALAALAVGIVTSIVQTATSVHEQTLSLVGRIGAATGVLVLCGPWMIGQLVGFTVALFSDLSRFVH